MKQNPLLSLLVCLILSLISLPFLSQCSDQTSEEKVEVQSEPYELVKIENVKKVFVHTPGLYTILYEDSDTKELTHSNYLNVDYYAIQKKMKEDDASWYSVRVDLKMFNDAEPGKGWMVIWYHNHLLYKVEIHTSIDSVTGGDFSYKSGKHNRTGTTRAIE